MVFFALAEPIQLVPDGTLFLHIAIILLMVAALNKTLFRPINRILEERERSTTGRTGEAHVILQDVEDGITQYERSLKDARGESYRLLEQERLKAMHSRQSMIDLVKDEVSNLIQNQKEIIQVQTENARTILVNEAQRVAVSVSAQILGRSK